MNKIKKFFVIGNPINHSLSPELQNYWLKKNNINAIYDKQRLDIDDLKDFVLKIKSKEIAGANITVPFKKEIIPFIDKLTPESEGTDSVNTILLNKGETVGYNTDIIGFEKAIKETNYNFLKKKVLILGAGGVVPSIIFALQRMGVKHIMLSNRTKLKAEELKNYYKKKNSNENIITVVDWGELPNFDVIINATSVGLKRDQTLNLDFSKIEKGKFFYDVIYNPKETNFLKAGKQLGNQTENGKKMFIYQSAEAFRIWHKIEPEINEEINKLLDQ
tara:strand:- start:2267 stop:3091 length:825 start_codon:yes stop_codon:yes gene_type:complete